MQRYTSIGQQRIARATPRSTTASDLNKEFRQHVISGLSASPKKLSSRYFYDATGDRLFQGIMASPDYYLTRCEDEILRTYSGAIAEALAGDAEHFEVIELGAGDGSKTARLLAQWISDGRQPLYRPVDISANAIGSLKNTLSYRLPSLKIDGLQGEYHAALERIGVTKCTHRTFLFLGSNIGNMDHDVAVQLLRKITARMQGGDRLMIGLDLKKDPRVILRAYDDRAGVTREFNLNLLHRINRELGANFDVDAFMHAPVYDPENGRALSYLVSKTDQQVKIPGAPRPFEFRAWESIHTETSQKYDMPQVNALACEAGLQVIESFSDRKRYFADIVLGLK